MIEIYGSNGMYQDILLQISEGIYSLDRNGNFIFVNDVIAGRIGKPHEWFIGRDCFETISHYVETESVESLRENFITSLQGGKAPLYVLTYKNKFGNKKWAEINTTPLQNNDEIIGVNCVIRNITRRKKFEKRLKETNRKMEIRVKERTIDLTTANNKLQEKIAEHKNTLEFLKKREQELDIINIELKNTNTALNIMLNNSNKEKKQVAENILLNIKTMITPFIRNTKKTAVNNEQLVRLTALESALNEIISPFAQNLSSKLINFTPIELKIVNFIRQGKITREIAVLLDVSSDTISRHRKNIRKKLSLSGKKMNLRTCLLALT